MNQSFAVEFGKAFIFKKIRSGIRSFFLKAGYDDVPYALFGWLFIITAIITGITYVIFVYPLLAEYTFISVFLLTFLSWIIVQGALVTLAIILLYFNLNIHIYKRTKELEYILPDYLQMVSANLKGGMSFEKSLWNAIKPEFGIISKEISIVYKKVMTGNDLTDALREFTNKYNSPLMRRSFDLIIGELETGGKISHIVDKVIENIIKTKQLSQEMSSATLSYIIFIGAIVMLVAPALFALSYHLLKVMIGFSSKLANVSSTALPISINALQMNPGDFRIFSILALVVISLFSSLIVSIIEKGDIRGGLKYIPMFIISSIVVYFILLNVLNVLFKGLGTG
ncbi:MAG: type II secretion system F family protein [Candidatus Woesearchaeota archaeon]